MELLKEFEKIQLLVDDKNNVRDFNITAKKLKEKYPCKKYLGISNGTSTIIFERETGKIVYGVKTEWNKV